MMSGKKKVILIACVIAVLLAAALAAVSCGGGSGTSTTTVPGSTKLTGNHTVDNYLDQLDQQMNSVGSEDFSDSQLSNSALGQ
jgi:ABC-type oligopeptide transport system substrate-binding subunit